MINLRIVLDAEGQFPEAEFLGQLTAAGRLPNGLRSGKSAVILEVKRPDGTRVYAQTSLSLFAQAARVFSAAEGEVDESMRLREALTKIQHASNGSSEHAVWMQKVAAHALDPKWPEAGAQP